MAYSWEATVPSTRDHSNRTQHAGVFEIPWTQVADADPLPVRQTFWDGASISAGDTSDPLIVAGWSRKTVHFVSDTAGTLTVEVDPVNSGDWHTYDTVSVSADEMEFYEMPADVARIRLSFDTAATVTGRAQLRP